MRCQGHRSVLYTVDYDPSDSAVLNDSAESVLSALVARWATPAWRLSLLDRNYPVKGPWQITPPIVQFQNIIPHISTIYKTLYPPCKVELYLQSTCICKIHQHIPFPSTHGLLCPLCSSKWSKHFFDPPVLFGSQLKFWAISWAAKVGGQFQLLAFALIWTVSSQTELIWSVRCCRGERARGYDPAPLSSPIRVDLR